MAIAFGKCAACAARRAMNGGGATRGASQRQGIRNKGRRPSHAARCAARFVIVIGRKRASAAVRP
ncbi:hypothetical protein BURPS668_A0362 [Burkholderia pseudomallei 668]|nr:hypothetical protein BURPS668_A0362 [Burkholderia pseudomallei 668]